MTGSIDIRNIFFQECEELLEALDDGLNAVAASTETGSCDAETVNAVFRAVHSIKGGAAAFGLEALVRFAHQFETVLDAVRSGRLEPTQDIVRIFQRSADHLSNLVASGRDQVTLPPNAGQELIEKLAHLVEADTPQAVAKPTVPAMPAAQIPTPETVAADDLGFQPIAFSFDFGPAIESLTSYQIRFSAAPQLFANGNDATHLFRALAELGTLQVTADTSTLPALEELDWSYPYLSWELTLETSEPLHAIQEVFEFVEGSCRLEIEAISATSATTEIAAMPDPVESPPPQPANTPLDKPSNEPPVSSKSGANSAAVQKGSVRVDLDLVDRLINIVGELVINQAVLAQCVQDSGLPGLTDISSGLDEFRNLARELQENVMAIRAQSVKPLFQRMARIVREASDIAGKTVNFETEGEAAEVDKTVIERLVDPLTHIVRNAVDHGLETAEVRRAAGKPETGCVRLTAAHRSGRVLIEVSDDGGGINRPRVKQIAIDKGLIAPDAVLSDQEIDKLLFLPGFSTASKVTDLSGRGVGMDVVRSAIQGLGGRVNIASTPGKGTTLSISLPLTLAVLDGMVVDVAGQTMVVPITAIIETLRPMPSDIHGVGATGYAVAVRETFVPIIDLAHAFGHRDPATDYSSMVLLLVECGDDARWALAVDRIYDQRQVVIKGLETNYGHVPGVAAATILGDGRIALIIDPEETAQRAQPRPVPQPVMNLEDA